MRLPLLDRAGYLARVRELVVSLAVWDPSDPWEHGLQGMLQRAKMRPIHNPTEWDSRHGVVEEAVDSGIAICASRLLVELEFCYSIRGFCGSREDALLLLDRAIASGMSCDEIDRRGRARRLREIAEWRAGREV